MLTQLGIVFLLSFFFSLQENPMLKTEIGKLLTTPSRLFKLILPLSTLHRDAHHKGMSMLKSRRQGTLAELIPFIQT